MASIIHQPDCFMCVLCLKDSPRSGASGLTSVGLKPKRKGTLRGEVRITHRKGVKDGKTGRESERGCDRREKGKKKKEEEEEGKKVERRTEDEKGGQEMQGHVGFVNDHSVCVDSQSLQLSNFPVHLQDTWHNTPPPTAPPPPPPPMCT